jgi:predicted DNA-binding transcriptional regulator AlpA
MDTAEAKFSAPGVHANQLLRINDVVALTTLSKSCVNLWVAQGRFPKPTALSSTVKVWKSSDISAWINEQFEQANDFHTEICSESCQQTCFDGVIG